MELRYLKESIYMEHIAIQKEVNLYHNVLELSQTWISNSICLL